jgi:protein dithiol:quinone oxidoreductase
VPLTPRAGNTLGFLACAGLMAYALYAQHVLGLEPCPLCVFQRVGVIAMGVVFALAALHNPGAIGRRVYAAVLALAALGAGGVAARHLWLQTLPPERVPACGPGLDYMLESFPFTEVLQTVLSGSGECAKVDWSLLGLAMPAWVLIAVVVLAGLGLWNNLRAGAPRFKSSATR